MKQTVAHAKLKPLQGLALIAALMVVLILLNYLLSLLSPYVGYTVASIGFWLIGGVLAVALFHVYVSAYTYDLGEDVLRICRCYGKRERFLEDVYLNRLLYIGAPDETARRYPAAKKLRATHSASQIDQTALAYQTPDGERILIFQPDAEMRARLVARVRGK